MLCLCFSAWKSVKAAIVFKCSLIDPSGASFLFRSWWRHSLSARSALSSLCLWACEMSQSVGRAPPESHWSHLENLYEYVLKVLFFGDRLYANLPQMPSSTLAGILFCNLVQVWLNGIFRVFLFSSTNVRVFASAGPVLQVYGGTVWWLYCTADMGSNSVWLSLECQVGGVCTVGTIPLVKLCQACSKKHS